MNTTQPRTSSIRQLKRELTGDVLLPGDQEYERARTVYNTMHEFWPAVIVRAADVADVATTVRFARDDARILAVRGGNHSVRGFGSCNDGVVLDLDRLDAVAVDPGARVARVGGGATWADVNEATHAHGLATTGGLISTTGVGGLTLGGGIGYLTRRLGLACDNLAAADIVTARGDVLHVDHEHEPDLFYAIRGGGGNFGVVTEFTFRLAPIRTVVAGPLVFALDAGVVRRFGEILADAPPELGAILGLTLAPPLPFLPAERHGTPVAIVVACWSGHPDAAHDALRELRAAGSFLGGNVQPMPYPVINTLFDALLPAGLRHYWASRFVDAVPSTAIESWVEHARRSPTIESGIFFYPVDGAAHEVDPRETAWPARNARFLIGFHGSWHDLSDDEANTRWVREAHADSAPWALAAEYVNFTSDPDMPGTTQYGDRTERLIAAKRTYDPNNLFCLNANIDPEPAM